MRASLASRETIADSIELAVSGHCLDAMVLLVGCDKTIPAAAMAAARLDIPCVILYGGTIMVRQWQELFFERRYSEIDLSDNPDFGALARAFGVHALQVERADGVEAALRALLDAPGPAVLHVAIDTAANVWPLVPPNHNNAQMLDADDVASLPPATQAGTTETTPTDAKETSHALPA